MAIVGDDSVSTFLFSIVVDLLKNEEFVVSIDDLFVVVVVVVDVVKENGDEVEEEEERPKISNFEVVGATIVGVVAVAAAVVIGIGVNLNCALVFNEGNEDDVLIVDISSNWLITVGNGAGGVSITDDDLVPFINKDDDVLILWIPFSVFVNNELFGKKRFSRWIK